MQESERYANIQVLVITGLGEKTEEVKSIGELGVEKVFYKPFDVGDLIAAIKEINASLGLEKKRGAEPLKA